ncbi:hypothetical protein ACOSQ2_004142 [Xanthoceras sorbifolium]
MRGWFEMFKGGQKSTKPNGTGPNVPPVGYQEPTFTSLRLLVAVSLLAGCLIVAACLNSSSLAVRRRCPLVAARLVLAALPLAVTGRRCRFAACYYFVVLSVNGTPYTLSNLCCK